MYLGASTAATFLWIIRSMCLFHLNTLSKMTRRKFALWTHWICFPSMLIWSSGLSWFHPIRMAYGLTYFELFFLDWLEIYLLSLPLVIIAVSAAKLEIFIPDGLNRFLESLCFVLNLLDMYFYNIHLHWSRYLTIIFL